VIDGPQAADLALSAIKAADFILIPVQPSPYDIWAASDLVDLIKQRIEITDGRLQAAFVVSRVIKGTRSRQGSERGARGLRLTHFGDAHHPARDLSQHGRLGQHGPRCRTQRGSGGPRFVP